MQTHHPLFCRDWLTLLVCMSDGLVIYTMYTLQLLLGFLSYFHKTRSNFLQFWDMLPFQLIPNSAKHQLQQQNIKKRRWLQVGAI